MKFEEFNQPYLDTVEELQEIGGILNGYMDGEESHLTEAEAELEATRLEAKLEDLILKCNIHRDSLGVYEILVHESRRDIFQQAEDGRGKGKLLFSLGDKV